MFILSEIVIKTKKGKFNNAYQHKSYTNSLNKITSF